MSPRCRPHESLMSSKDYPVLQASFCATRNFAFHGTKEERSTILEKGLFFSLLSWSLGKEISKEGFSVKFVFSAVESLFALCGYRAAGEVGTVWDAEHEYAREALHHLITTPLANQCARLLTTEEGSTSIEKCMNLQNYYVYSKVYHNRAFSLAETKATRHFVHNTCIKPSGKPIF